MSIKVTDSKILQVILFITGFICLILILLYMCIVFICTGKAQYLDDYLDFTDFPDKSNW